MRAILLTLAVLVAFAAASPICPHGLKPNTYDALDYNLDPYCVDSYGAQCGLNLIYAPSALFLPPLANDLSIDTSLPAFFNVPAGFEGAHLVFTAYEGPQNAPTQLWEVDITFTGFQASCNPSKLTLDLRPTCYVANGGAIDPSCWQCYSDFTGYLTALSGPYAGLVLSVSKKFGTVPQIGYGADGKDCAFGATIPFKWEIYANPLQCFVPPCEKKGEINIVLHHNCPPSIKGDPHFVGFDGVKFDFHGEPDSVFNIISDSNMQLNALFVASDRVQKSKTYLGALGLTVGENRLLISCNREKGEHIMQFNGRDLVMNEVIPLDEEGTLMLGDDSKVNIDLNNFFLKVRFSSSAHSSCHINLRASYKSDEDYAALPHGILGQTANKNRVVEPAKEPGMNGEGAIEGAWTDYLLSSGDVFGSDFKFNRFTATSSAGVSKRAAEEADHKQGGFLHGASH